MPVVSSDIVNEALQLIGDDGPAVTGVWPNFDGSTNGNIAMLTYGPAVDAAMRAHNYDFARTVVALALSGNAAPLGWAYEYLYPVSAIQLWQVTPPFPLADPNDPLPTRWNVGAAIVATNPDPFCPTPDGGLPDCAAMLAAVEACTGARAEAIVGKPSAHMGRAILARLGTAPQDSVIVGDRLLTDIAMADELGKSSVLVLTGATRRSDLSRSHVQPDFVIDSLRDVLPNRLDRQ